MNLPPCFDEQPPDPIRFADELQRRADELVFITRDDEGAVALREWGLLAICRPDGGRWSLATLRPLTGRDVAIVNPEAWGDRTWAERDVQELTDTARRVGMVTPIGFEGKSPPRDLAEYVARQKALGFGLQGFVKEALGCLEDQMPRVAATRPPRSGGPFCFGASLAIGPFPVDVLPMPVAEFAREVAEAIGCLPDLVGLPILVVAGAAIGRSTSLMLKPGYFVSASLYGMNISPCHVFRQVAVPSTKVNRTNLALPGTLTRSCTTNFRCKRRRTTGRSKRSGKEGDRSRLSRSITPLSWRIARSRPSPPISRTTRAACWSREMRDRPGWRA